MSGDLITAARRPDGRRVAVGAVAAAGCVVVTVLSGVAALLVAVRTGLRESTYTVLPLSAAIGVLGGLLAARRPRNVVGWGFTATGLVFTVALLAEQYAQYGLVTRPGSLPGAQVALWLQGWLFAPALIPLFVLVPLYFPDGRLPSARWRWLPPSALVLMAVIAALVAFEPADVRLGGVSMANPYGIEPLRTLGWLTDASELLWLLLVLVAVGSLLLRFRRAAHEQRQQIKWLLYALAVVSAGFIVDAVVALTASDLYPVVFPVVQVLPVTVVVAACIAILRHQLFDIDLLINRTLVYGTLTVCLVVGYVLVVTWIGAMFGSRSGAAAAVATTAAVAVAFAPLRDRLQRLVNQLLYGDRDDPYGVLLRLGRRLEAVLAPGAVLPTVVATVAEALKLPYAAVELGRDETLVAAAEHGHRPADPARLLQVPLTHAGEHVGRLTLAPRSARENLSAADRRILADLAPQIGAAVHAVRLSANLQRSREQLVVAREEERRRVGRDLHDGLGPQLASLTMKVEAARDLIAADPDRAVELLSELLAQTERTVADLRRVAHRLRPPVLDSLGLIDALRVHASGQQKLPVHWDVPDELPQLTAAAEVAAYHIALEAFNNVALHAHATRCTVRLRHDGATVCLEIADDGVGTSANDEAGVGLSSMRERAAELGGSCTVEPNPGGGTLLRAAIPSASQALTAPGQGA